MRLGLRSARGRGDRGFTLVEVMLALAILGMALVMLMRSAASSLFATSQAQMLGVVTDLARGKMYDLEEQLLKDGFNTADQTEQGDFADAGWATVEWEAKIETAEMPNLDTMKEVGGQRAKAEAEAQQSKATGGLAGAGTGSAGETAATATSGFIEQYYSMISEVLKTSMRKVTLTVKWKVLGRDRDMKVIYYVTDPEGLMKAAGGILAALGGNESGDEGSNAGSNANPRSSPQPGGSK